MIKVVLKKVYDDMLNEIDSQDKTILYLQQQLSKQNQLKQENEYLQEKNSDYILKIKELRKEIKKLKSV